MDESKGTAGRDARQEIAPQTRAAPGDGERSKPQRAREFTEFTPKLALPKGGGAIRSIGEKFSVNAATGAGSLSVPISAPQMRGAPELALSYDSGSGNGPFGIGWSLSSASISRKTDRGLPLYEKTDIFVMSGVEDLQRKLIHAGAGAWTLDEHTDAVTGFRVIRYRPRTEGDFSRIEQRINMTDPADCWWLCVSKDNVRSYYGHYPSAAYSDDSATIADPKAPRRIFSWLLTEIIQPNGSRALFEYKPEDNANVRGEPCEDLRRLSSQPQKYLKRVHYGNAPAGVQAPDWACTLVFDYGEHHPNDPRVEENFLWDHRLDSFSRCRSRFEIRTRRLCQRILCFQNFTSLGPSPVLTRSTEFDYDPDPVGARLAKITHKGFATGESGNKTELSAPAVTFDYSTAKPADVVQFVKGASLRNAPQGVTSPYSFVDIDGEGLPGVLSEHVDGWRYKRNLGEGEFGALEVLAYRPEWASLVGGARIASIESDGQPYVVAYAGPLTGYSAREDDGGWGPFRAFEKIAAVDFNAPDVRHIDLDGDGKADIAILRDEEIVWRRNEGRLGFSEEGRTGLGDNELRGPRRVFLNNLESIFTADMTGDGLEDIVRIRNGNVAYWPNLGYGRFGEKVVMAAPPIFDAEDRFSTSRIKLGDIDGLGTTDILYVGAEGAAYWINQSGNQFGEKKTLPTFPRDDGFSDAALADLLGNGTSCLVWSTPLPAHQEAPWRYLDLMGGVKPYLLTRVNNGAGAETRLTYKPSTYYYLRDKRLGRPWATKLPFPVQVVDRVDTEDCITGNVHVTRYAYHHGYYDRPEREFRGFGCVDEWATEGKASHGAQLFERPPVLSRRWYHTGAFAHARSLSTQFKAEYAAIEPDYELTDSILELSEVETGDPVNVYSASERREAGRALRGRLLRQEIYQCDQASDPAEFPAPHVNPYTITEHRYAVRRLQPIDGGNEHAVFIAGELETLARHYEERASDARIVQELTLQSNDYGEKTRAASIAYGRAAGEPEQMTTRISVSESEFINVDTGYGDFIETAWRRIGALKAVRSWELETSPPTPKPYDIANLNLAFDGAVAADPGELPEYATLPLTGSRKRLLKASVRLFRAEADAAALDFTPLDFGVIDGMALPGRDFSLIFSRRMLEDAGLRAPGDDDAASKIKLSDLTANGYVRYADLIGAPELSNLTAFKSALLAVEGAAAGSWWVQDGVARYDPTLFYLVKEARDPWGAVTTVTHDAIGILPESVTDALGSKVTVVNDYRALAPAKVTDPNGNVREAAFDAMGRIVKIAVSGVDEYGAAAGDTLASSTQIFEYQDHEAEQAPPKPNYAHVWSRHTHFHDLDAATQGLAPLQQGVWSEARAYGDGFGRELETKQRVPRGTAWQADVTGKVAVSVVADPRWVGTGRTLYDNRGDPVRKYEPYFSTTADYEEEDALRLWGVSPVIHYDPLGRAVRTDFPDGSYSKVEFSPWHEKTWDQNDTVRLTDANSGGLVDSQWFSDRFAPDPTTPPPASADEYPAWVAAAHADTPAEKILDALGRPVLAIERNARIMDDPIDPTNGPKTIAAETCTSRTLLDIAGNALEIKDANNNCALKQVFDLAGRPLHTISNDAGKRWLLPAADGQPGVVIGERGFRTETEYDMLRRPTKNWVTDASNVKRLANKIVYGETAPNAAGSNLIGQIWKSFDQAGEFVNHVFGLKGEAKKTGRRLLADPTVEPDWAAPPPLDAEEHFILYKVDAEGRNVWEKAPDGSELTFAYDIAGRFVASTVKHASQPGPTTIVSNIDYDGKGQRTSLAYGNGAVTTYAYDTKTFRLAQLQTTAPSGPVQDIRYTYDAAGNIVEIVDAAQATVFTSNAMVAPKRRFRYDALYRLIRAEGREHQSLATQGNSGLNQRFPAPSQPSPPQPQLADGTKIQNYVQTYDYDKVGNIKRTRHQGLITSTGWTRDYSYDYEQGGDSNRLVSTTVSGDPAEAYAHDAHGNIQGLSHLGGLQWDHADRLREAALATAGHRELYAYDAAGERVLKRTEKNPVVEERIYLGPMFEIHRVFSSGAKTDERTTLHIIDGETRIAMMETATWKNGAPTAPAPALRYEIGDHLGSAQLELTDAGDLLSYEEFHPYGTTAVYSEYGGSGDYSTKRYRFTGKERDEATGLSYHSARYYMPWLGRWLSADPAGLVDGPGLYFYARDNPGRFNDPTGNQGDSFHRPHYYGRGILHRIGNWIHKATHSEPASNPASPPASDSTTPPASPASTPPLNPAPPPVSNSATPRASTPPPNPAPQPIIARVIRVSGSPVRITVYGNLSPQVENALANDNWLSRAEIMGMSGDVGDGHKLFRLLKGYDPGQSGSVALGRNTADRLTYESIKGYQDLPRGGNLSQNPYLRWLNTHLSINPNANVQQQLNTYAQTVIAGINNEPDIALDDKANLRRLLFLRALIEARGVRRDITTTTLAIGGVNVILNNDNLRNYDTLVRQRNYVGLFRMANALVP